MTKKDKEFRLCYVNDNIMFFTDNFDKAWGDDWNDRPYEHNAGDPYEVTSDKPVRDGYGHIRKVAFEPYWNIRRPCDGFINSPYSVAVLKAARMPIYFGKRLIRRSMVHERG